MKTSFINAQIRRALTATLACVLALVVATGLAACVNPEEEKKAITTELTTLFDAFKNPTAESLAPYIAGIDRTTADDLTSYGIDINDFMTHLLRNFDYQLSEPELDGRTATVSVTLTNANIADALKAAEEYILSDDAREAATAAYAESGQAGVVNLLFQDLYARLDSADPSARVSTTITLSLEKNDEGEWQLAPESIDDLTSALFGGVTADSL